MKFLLSDDSKYIADILAETGCLNVNQIHRLLRLVDHSKSLGCAKGVMGQLCYSNNAIKLSEDVIAPLFLERRDADFDMLIAVDIMLDLLKNKPKAITTKRHPFKLSFLAGSDIPIFAIAIVSYGKEREINTYLESCMDEITAIFLVSELEQARKIKVNQPHYFAVMDNQKLRYFKGE